MNAMILKRLVTGFYDTNTYIIIDNEEAVVIDPGADAEKILQTVKDCGAKIKSVLLTHAHFDHVGAVAQLKKHGCSIYMSLIDSELFDMICGLGEDIFVEPFGIDAKLNDGDVLKISGHEIKALSTPGHTPGSLCYIVDDEMIFSGDTLFRLSVGRTDFIGGDRNALAVSLNKLFMLPHDYKVYPGHGAPTTLAYEKEHNPYAR